MAKHLLAKDIRQGITMYEAKPFGGIAKLFVLSRPRVKRVANSKFVVFDVYVCDYNFKHDVHVGDCGLNTHSGNDARCFKKKKHAQAYLDRMEKDPKCIKRYKDHQRECDEMDKILGNYEDFYDMHDEIDSAFGSLSNAADGAANAMLEFSKELEMSPEVLALYETF